MEPRSKFINVRIRPTVLEMIRAKSKEGFSQADVVEEAVMRFFGLMTDEDIDVRAKALELRNRLDYLDDEELKKIALDVRNAANKLVQRVEAAEKAHENV